MKDYELLRLTDQSLLHIAQKHVSKTFGDDTWPDLNREDFHTLIATCQNKLNVLGLARQLAADLQPALGDLIGSSNMMVQSNLYLRAARPAQAYDAIDWHRESFYGCQPQAWNIWLPVANVTPVNSLRYIPGSASIPDEDITVSMDGSGVVAKGSDGHKIGLLYAPKRIVGGVDLSLAKPMEVPEGSAALFPSQLVHGAAHNLLGKIRFSLDFRVIAEEYVGQQKKSFAGDGKEFFVLLKEAA